MRTNFLICLCTVGLASCAGDGPIIDTDTDTDTDPPAPDPFLEIVPDGGLGWNDARTAAEGRSLAGVAGQLASAETEAEAQALAAIGQSATTNWWIGGFEDTNASDYAEPDGGWRWVSGASFSVTRWQCGEPNNAQSTENLLELWDTGNWAEAPPNNPSFNGGYVVEYDAVDVNPAYDASSGSYYLTITGDYRTWADARAVAQSLWLGDRQGELVSITSSAEQAFIASELGFGHYWIGVFQDTSASDFSEPAGGWRWASGEPFSYTNWTSGEPNEFGGGGENWMSTGPGGGWNDNQRVWDYTPGNEGLIVEFAP